MVGLVLRGSGICARFFDNFFCDILIERYMNKTPHRIGRGGLVGIALATVLGACAAAASLLEAGDLETNLHDVSVQDDKACVESVASKVSSARPVDVIFVIDNSGSMGEEISSITKNINDHFAKVMSQAGLDYRVIMIVKHGVSESWNVTACFEAPLSTIPVGGCANIGSSPPGNNPGKFYHYSYDVQSNDSPCVILDTLFSKNYRPDMFGLAPDGWIKWLRSSAFKVFVEVTDDSPGCWWYPDADKPEKKKVLNDFQSALGGQVFAIEFDKLLTKVAPEHFGTPENRNYVFYSIVGMMEKPDAVDEDFGEKIDPNGKPEDPFFPEEEIVSNICSTAVTAGHGYQSLSKLTGGLRFPVCQADKFDVVFQKIADSIDSITSSICTIEIPTSGDEGPIDVSTAKLKVDKIGSNASYLILVKDENSCTGAPDEYYVDEVGSFIALCPEACKSIKSSSQEISLTAGCVPSVE